MPSPLPRHRFFRCRILRACFGFKPDQVVTVYPNKAERGQLAACRKTLPALIGSRGVINSHYGEKI